MPELMRARLRYVSIICRLLYKGVGSYMRGGLLREGRALIQAVGSYMRMGFYIG